MLMLNVTDLATYLFCSRKIYLQKVLNIRTPIKDALIKGTIKHQVVENLNKIEQSIVEDIKQPLKLTDIELIYQEKYKQIFLNSIEQNKQALAQFNIDPKLFFEQSWHIYRNEASERAISVSNIIEEKKLLSKDLWNNIEPRIFSEVRVSSDELKIKGIIDKIEVYKDKIIPIELKSGKLPFSGVWPGNKIQLIAYCLLAQEHFQKQVSEGIVHYVDHNEKRKIVLNPFSKIELVGIRDSITKIIDTKQAPLLEKSSKCEFCDFKQHCHNLK